MRQINDFLRDTLAKRQSHPDIGWKGYANPNAGLAASSASPFNVGASRGNTYASAVAAVLEPQPCAAGW